MPKTMTLVWTDAKVNELLEFRSAGLSATEIAKRMHSTRSAILGKINRLGLSVPTHFVSVEERLAKKKSKIRRETEARRAKRFKLKGEGRPMQAPRPKVEAPKFDGFKGIPFADLKSFSGAEANECRYIAAEWPAPDYIACGAKTLPGVAYCEHCKTIVSYRPYEVSESDRERRAANMRRLARPATVAGLDITEEAA